MNCTKHTTRRIWSKRSFVDGYTAPVSVGRFKRPISTSLRFAPLGSHLHTFLPSNLRTLRLFVCPRLSHKPLRLPLSHLRTFNLFAFPPSPLLPIGPFAMLRCAMVLQAGRRLHLAGACGRALLRAHSGQAELVVDGFQERALRG